MKHMSILLAVSLAILPLTGCGQADGPSSPADTPHGSATRRQHAMSAEAPVEVGAVPDFSFTERSGRTVTLADLKGKVWTAAFFFTRCTTICIPMNLEMKELQDEFRDQPEFMIVATTVEPDHDTPEVLRSHAKRYEAQPDRWWFLTGPIDDVKEFAHEGLKIQWHPDSPLLHSPYFVLVDGSGVIRGYYNQTEPDDMERLRGDIVWLLKHKDAA